MSKRLYEESTVLELGARGEHASAGFELVGRTCIASDSGGIWNEWVMRYDGGHVRWLAEARGEFVVYDDAFPIFPPHDLLVAGESVDFIVVERGEGTRVATWGDVPDSPKRYKYADLVSRRGALVTVDWSSPFARIYSGAKWTLKGLGLQPRKGRRRLVPAPNVSRPKSVTTWLDVGDEGELHGRFRVAGIVARSMKVDGERWSWVEYFLDSAEDGFRWLSESDGHWSFVSSIDAHRAEKELPKYKRLSSGTARVDWAAGELPWKVEIGETVAVEDWLQAPNILSREATEGEINWSVAQYVPPSGIASAFGKRSLPKPVGRALHQPRKR